MKKPTKFELWLLKAWQNALGVAQLGYVLRKARELRGEIKPENEKKN